MTTEEWTSIIKIAEERWETNQTLTDSDIYRMGSHIVSTPTIDNTSDGGEKLFTLSQMYEMFRLGFYIRQRVGVAKRAVKKRDRTKGPSTYMRMKKLDVGEKLILPIDEYMAARSTASYFKRTFSTIFKVNKISEDTIVVTRNR